MLMVMLNSVVAEENSIAILQNLKIELSHDSAILLLDIYSTKWKVESQWDICTPLS